MGDDHHLVLYIDGMPVRGFPYYDYKTKYEEEQRLFIADTFHPAAQMSEVRFFSDRLTSPEMKTMYDEWLSTREGGTFGLTMGSVF